MKDKPFPIWLCRLLSYMSAFTCGGYVYGAVHGNPPETYRWIITVFFGLMFFWMSLPDKEKKNGSF